MNRKQDPRVRYQVYENLGSPGAWKPVGKAYRFLGHAEAYRRRASNYDLRIEEVPALGYRWADCTGEAHSNAYIDHCGVCMPRWGRVLVEDTTADYHK